jgi:hypothetical protein
MQNAMFSGGAPIDYWRFSTQLRTQNILNRAKCYVFRRASDWMKLALSQA